MSKVLVAYGSKHGATAEIAQAIADEIERHGVAADCLAADEVHDVEPYDGVVVGSAVYMKRWRRPAQQLLRRHQRELAERALWIFSSGPVGEDADPSWSEPGKVVDLAEKLGVRDHVVFGGKLPDEPEGFIQKAMVKDIPEEFRDLRDFDQIRAWAGGIAEAVREKAKA
jgi:menaquinone-dependent protoporphyrinogen oxidase